MHFGAVQQQIARLFLPRVPFVATASRQHPGSHILAGAAAPGAVQELILYFGQVTGEQLTMVHYRMLLQAFHGSTSVVLRFVCVALISCCVVVSMLLHSIFLANVVRSCWLCFSLICDQTRLVTVSLSDLRCPRLSLS